MSTPRKSPQQSVPSAELNEESRARLGRAFWAIARHYKLTREEQAIVLGLKPSNRQRLGSLESKLEIPDDVDKALRVGLLLGIHKNLRIIYPKNRDLVYDWMKTPREMFGGQSAMQFIAGGTDTMPRLFTVRRILDQVRCGL